MSAAFRGDASIESVFANNTHPDVSLGSNQSSFISPQKGLRTPRLPSATSAATASSSAPLSTPSPPSGPGNFLRRQSEEPNLTPLASLHANKMAFFDDAEPELTMDTPALPRTKRGRSSIGGAKGATNLTLREQEKVIDAVKKENFNLKLKVHFLEERLTQLAPDHYDAALKQNISLKLEVHARGVEMKKYKKLLLELERELERKAQHDDPSPRERELQSQLERREQELRELRRRKGGMVSGDDLALREAEAINEDLNQRAGQLEEELERARGIIEENVEEMDRLRDALERRGDNSLAHSESRRPRLERRVAELEALNEELQHQVDDQHEMIAQRDDEKDQLQDEVERLMLEAEEYQHRHEAEILERSRSRAEFVEEREDRQALEDELNTTRDKLAATTIELQQRDEDHDAKCQEIDDIVLEHERIVATVESQWREEVDESRQQVEELRDALAERDAVAAELRLHISELESNTSALHDKFEQALAHVEQQAEEREAELEATTLELEAANQEIERLGRQVWELEELGDKIREDYARKESDDAAERDRVEATLSTLKDKLVATKAQLQEATSMCEACREELIAHRAREEELARHIEDIVEERNQSKEALERAEEELTQLRRKRDEDARRGRRELADKESALQSALNELSIVERQLSQRDKDITDLQSALGTLENQSRRLGESHSSDRFSLELELDRVKRDLSRSEDELARLRKELAEKEARYLEKEGAVDRFHSENRDLVTQLAAQTQARLNVSEKLDGVQSTLRAAEAELSVFRSRANDLEARLSKDQRTQVTAEHQYRDQLTERNTLLLTVYQYIDKILGVDKAAKGIQAEMKPFTNFNVFHDNLISRMKALSQIQLDFDKQCKGIEARFVERLVDVKKQLDFRWKQIDRFESSVKTLAEVKHSWRRKYNTKEGEVDALKANTSELTAQISALRRVPHADGSEIRSLTARATNAERRLANAQNQLLSTEEKVAAMNEKTTQADGKWEARVKEYESRLRAAEERVKRERQGAKERVAELENNVKGLQKQVEQATRRNQHLHDVVQSSKAT